MVDLVVSPGKILEVLRIYLTVREMGVGLNFHSEAEDWAIFLAICLRALFPLSKPKLKSH